MSLLLPFSPSLLLYFSPLFPFLPSQIAAACGIAIRYETLPLAFGRVSYLAEASLQPPRITVNQTAIATLVECSTQVPAEQRPWFTASVIAEVMIAHELYHILTQQPSTPRGEQQAHQFAQAIMQLPFAPQQYEAILKQVVGWTTRNIT